MSSKHYIPLLLIAAASLPAAAQYDQDINVEGKYVPEIINHDRIGLFPRPVRFPLEKSTLDYSLSGVNADFHPQLVPISATGWNASRQWSNHRGYVELGLGSWLESTLSAGYRIIDSRESALGVRLQHNSTSLWKPNVAPEMSDTRMWRYDEAVGVYGHHTFGDKGRLDAALDYHIGNFNYYGYIPISLNPSDLIGTQSASDAPSAPSQTLNDIAARVAWHSPASLDNICWNAGASVRYFGYRSLYFNGRDDASSAYGLFRLPASRETSVGLDAGILFPTSTKSALGIDLDASLVTYADNSGDTGTSPLFRLPSQPDSYGMVSLTPFYRFTRSRLNIRIGAQIDLAFNAGPEADRYSTFHIAPSVKLDYNAGPVSFYLHALGGSRLNTLAANCELDYYQNPAVYSTTPVYSPIDSRLGVTFGPFSGFHAGFDVAYRISRGQHLGGCYQLMLNHAGFDPEAYGLPSSIDGKAIAYDFTPDTRLNLHGLSVGLNLGYDAGRYFRINAEGRYQRQNGKTGYFNGYDRPEWTADVTAESNPWSTLRLRLGYSLRAMRMMPVAAWFADTTPLNGTFLVTDRLPNTSMLNFGASYGITDNFDVWIQADNLLCRRNVYMPGLEEPGLRLAAGVGFRF